ncbi:cullin CDC53 [Ascoidea rubescens DSM 1968]|uniref:SCF ubiquitin ligase n=1 Tax=Ascoidea rubescens DSM 1968 TaxID=1344418 RepID=A0A1D2VB72_9ASCO|nr:SCF ubiquitin ligase [Ascoidea rubescens DSM 1968]ODV58944.1 SCF ubiquitin ligase [Ascoidea rubescens DSM 1968]
MKRQLDLTWSNIEPNLQTILGSNFNNAQSPKLHMETYTAVYNFCLRMSLTTNQSPSSFNSLILGYDQVIFQLYTNVRDYLAEYVNNLQIQPDENFLQFYVRTWSRFNIGSAYLNHIFDYLNRYWLTKQKTDYANDISDINTLCLVQWRDYMFNPNSRVLIDEILNQIELQRNNHYIDTSILSKAISSMVLLGINNNTTLSLYIDCFESVFLERTAKFYDNESNDYLKHHNVIDYMKKAESRINEEISRLFYLDDHTKPLLIETLDKSLIKKHAEELYIEFDNLLATNDNENVHRMYTLLKRVPDTLTVLANLFQNYVKREGLKEVLNIKNNSATTGNGPVNAKLYVKVLIKVYLKYKSIVREAFEDYHTFTKALDESCRDYINFNSIASPRVNFNNTGNLGNLGNSKTPEYLAKYADMLLKKKNKESDITNNMSEDDIMIIFTFLNDKDAFEIHYRKLLAKRLIYGTSSNLEAEESLITRLQRENSIEYTSKMTKMFQDMKASENLKNEFFDKVTKIPNKDEIIKDFNPYILSETMWPFKPYKYNFKLPEELEPTHDLLESLYTMKHSGRFVKWIWNLCRGEVKANLSRSGKPPFMLTMSLFQMSIILPFNKKPTYTFKELLDITELPSEQLAGNITPFVTLRLLNQSPPNAINPDTKFTVVKEYRSKRMRVNFAANIRIEQKQEEEDTAKEISDDRRLFLKACIVRIMKARKTLKHVTLLTEVINQSHSRFNAQPNDIKKCIDDLIERAYLKRQDGNNDVYEYLA